MNATSIELARGVGAAGAARRWLVVKLDRIPTLDAQAVEQVLVMASELVSNVIVHTDSVPRLSILEEPGALRIEVHDTGSGTPELQTREARRAGGNGLLIVDTWSESWGIEPAPDQGKTVWFVVAAVSA